MPGIIGNGIISTPIQQNRGFGFTWIYTPNTIWILVAAAIILAFWPDKHSDDVATVLTADGHRVLKTIFIASWIFDTLVELTCIIAIITSLISVARNRDTLNINDIGNAYGVSMTAEQSTNVKKNGYLFVPDSNQSYRQNITFTDKTDTEYHGQLIISRNTVKLQYAKTPALKYQDTTR